MMSTRIIALLACIACLQACGSDKKKGKSEATTETGSDVVDDPSSDDAVVQPPPSTGETGATGATGAQGPRGPSNPSIGLFDVNGQQVGIKFSDSTAAADIFLMDGKRALIDTNTGALRAPAFNFFCMYESNDCTGACYVYDRRWINVVVQDLGGQTWVAPKGASNLGAKSINSYVHDGGTCDVATISTLESYRADVYNHPSLSFPLNAPLDWGIVQ